MFSVVSAERTAAIMFSVVLGLIPGRDKILFFSPLCPVQFCGPPNHVFSGYQRHDSDCSHPSIAEVKNEWNYISIPPGAST
jgi:hypothetical protein